MDAIDPREKAIVFCATQLHALAVRDLINQRKTVADLPIDFTLDDSMAMSPAMKLSNFPRVVVGARI
jgi:type I site-specific restriction endonuclease